MANNKLFSDFAPQTTQQWMDRIAKDLKGADFDRKLVWRTNEGFNVQPFYREENLVGKEYMDTYPGDFPYVRGNKKDNNNWLVRQDIIVEDVKVANAKALEILNKGVDSVGFILNWKDLSKAELTTLLEGIFLDCVEVNFEKSHGSIELIKNLQAIATERGIALDKLNGGISIDINSGFSTVGNFCGTEESAYKFMKEAVEASKALPNYKVIAVTGSLFNNSGSSIVEELGFSLASGAEYLGKMIEAGLSVDDVAPKMRFNFATSSKYFMEIAKLRAGRMLWANIVKAFGASNEAVCKMFVHGETSNWNKSVYDPYVNMLRTQTETMSAVLGGLDSFTVNSFNSSFAAATDFSERIARNQQLLLKEESHFGEIADPAAGSYYIEALTESIADEAWKLFLAVEDKGGYLAAFKAGFVQDTIKATAQKRDVAIASRKENFLGTNQFPNFGEVLEAIPEAVLVPEDKTAKDAVCETLKPYRGAQAFEALRNKTDIYAKANGRPKVMMFPIGNLNMRKARAQFACNFFACAGFDVEDHNGFNTVEEGVKFVTEKNAKIVVLCSSDDEYATIAPELLKALNGSATLVVAGAPACADELKAKGVENFVNVRSNVLETLKAYQAELGI
ncbi:methylmalonyl-CoA mutase family protein [Ancylomarina sp. 16SWW S1-10-2]|uniref:methylmalonyl-CoA mutase family protein n=1 Tax=Ancylomarina sp. 16SWW S1-10-2 TaxID=2499681 RepID=UPI0012AE3FBC|nr:methylmalonyl-CoA mutase family protein [Ancylomarina sp. 16SWW S1-10-2]MRT92184.1 methylmalonyl-CoA mutase small subunit [Ancylomarina sp. 16SWW S1-10-2]